MRSPWSRSPRTSGIQRRTYPLEAAATVATGLGPSPIEQLRRFRPDVVHVHNLFPNFGKRWLRTWDGPMVATMHNYRPICPAATLFRDGRVCRDCLGVRIDAPGGPARLLPRQPALDPSGRCRHSLRA